MQTKATLPISLLPAGASPLVAAYFEFNHLKQLFRQGWLRRGIPPARCESVAEHTFGVAVLALFLAEAAFPDLDPLKVLRLALLHDFGEIYAGDIIPTDGISPPEKHGLERQAVEQVLLKLPNGPAYLALWLEYEAEASPEAGFVRQLDRLEMGLQAAVYERQGFADLGEFYASARAALTDAPLQNILAELEALRP